jgi:hypothetical protein
LENHNQILTEGLVQPEYFEDPIEAQLTELAVALFKDFRVPPTFSILVEECKKSFESEERKLYLKRLRTCERLEITDSERLYITEELRHFAGLQALKHAISESIEPLRSGDLAAARSLIKSSLAVGDSDSLPEINYFADVADRFAKDTDHVTVRTLIAELDNVLRGHGIGRREVGAVLAISGFGKSMFLCHVAKAAIVQNFKVVYYTIDDPADLISERLDGSFSGVVLHDMQRNAAKVISAVKRFGRRYEGNLIIKEYDPRVTLSTIDSHIDSLVARDFMPDLVIVDYANIVGPEDSTWEGNQYKTVGQVYEGLKRLSKRRNVAVWTAGQATRSAVGKELTTLSEIAESFEGVMHANVIVSLNRTAEEKARETMRLFLAKNKSGVSEVIIPINTNYSKGALYRKVGT